MWCFHFIHTSTMEEMFWSNPIAISLEMTFLWPPPASKVPMTLHRVGVDILGATQWDLFSLFLIRTYTRRGSHKNVSLGLLCLTDRLAWGLLLSHYGKGFLAELACFCTTRIQAETVWTWQGRTCFYSSGGAWGQSLWFYWYFSWSCWRCRWTC